MVEATRLGTVFASNLKAYGKWTSQQSRHAPSSALSGAALERAVMNIAAMFPKNVVQV